MQKSDVFDIDSQNNKSKLDWKRSYEYQSYKTTFLKLNLNMNIQILYKNKSLMFPM